MDEEFRPEGEQNESYRELKQSLIQNILDRNYQEAEVLLDQINAILVGKNRGDFLQPEPEKESIINFKLRQFDYEFEEFGFAGVIVYLGDEGYSRLLIEREDHNKVNIGLIDENCTDKVIARWKLFS